MPDVPLHSNYLIELVTAVREAITIGFTSGGTLDSLADWVLLTRRMTKRKQSTHRMSDESPDER